MGIPLNIDWLQILLHLFNFAILTLGLYLLLYKPVKKFMQKRKDYYLDLESQAAKRQAEIESLDREHKKRLENAEAEINEMAAAKIKEAEAVAAFQLETAKKQESKIISDARAAADSEYEKMLENAKKEITQIAVTATEKLLLENSSDVYEQFLSAASKERGDD